MAAKSTGAQAIARTLLAHGADAGFCVPGESYLALLDAFHDLRDRFHLITCRHEAAAANMAEADGKMTGRPGLCFVTRGPGATHASVGVHTAFQDSTPMILFVGQVARNMRGREAFQEVDFEAFFAPLAKWAVEVDKADALAPTVAEAWKRAISGRPGPVVVSLPEDILEEETAATVAAPLAPGHGSVRGGDIDTVLTALGRAKHPLIILGGAGWSEGGCRAIADFAADNDLPVAAAFRFQHLMDNRHANYVGDVGIGINPKLADRVRQADVILGLGPRFGEMTTSGYTLLKVPKPDQYLIHVHAGREELGRVYDAPVQIHARPGDFAEALMGRKLAQGANPDWLSGARADYLDWIRPRSNAGAVQLGEIYAWLNERLPDDAILTNGAGNYTGWLHRHFQYRTFRSQLAPTSGAMGYGLPAAIAAARRHPERTVVACAGDGCFLMAGNELATIAQYGLKLIVLVFNNGMYGTIRMHQERHFPGRISATDLINPDFTAYARSFGLEGTLVEKTEDFAPAFKAAQASKTATLIEIRVDPEAISTQMSLSDLKTK